MDTILEEINVFEIDKLFCKQDSKQLFFMSLELNLTEFLYTKSCLSYHGFYDYFYNVTVKELLSKTNKKSISRYIYWFKIYHEQMFNFKRMGIL